MTLRDVDSGGGFDKHEKIAYSIHMRETSEDEGEYIKLNTKGALRSVYLCFIIGASRENEHAYI